MRQWGPAGMPDAIRTTVESLGAHPHRGGFRAAIGTVFLGLPFETSLAQESAAPFEAWTIKPYLAALLLLDRHEIAALALTLGILAFAVVTAILLWRTPRRRATSRLPRAPQWITSTRSFFLSRRSSSPGRHRARSPKSSAIPPSSFKATTPVTCSRSRAGSRRKRERTWKVRS